MGSMPGTVNTRGRHCVADNRRVSWPSLYYTLPPTRHDPTRLGPTPEATVGQSRVVAKRPVYTGLYSSVKYDAETELGRKYEENTDL